LQQYNLFVLPSRSEGFPLAIVEAMLAAHSVIATRVGSIAEAVIPNETDILIEKDDVAGLVAALCRLRDDAALRERLGQQGRALAIARFAALQMAQRYEEIWQTVVSMPRSLRLYVPRPHD
jgi:glycosyltransferase involved in cell wall biosynthesis